MCSLRADAPFAAAAAGCKEFASRTRPSFHRSRRNCIGPRDCALSRFSRLFDVSIRRRIVMRRAHLLLVPVTLSPFQTRVAQRAREAFRRVCRFISARISQRRIKRVEREMRRRGKEMGDCLLRINRVFSELYYKRKVASGALCLLVFERDTLAFAFPSVSLGAASSCSSSSALSFVPDAKRRLSIRGRRG